MIYLSHGYIDIFNHELRQKNTNNLILVTKPNGVIFQSNNSNNYNSYELTNKVLEKVIQDLKVQKISYKNLELRTSILKFSNKIQPNICDNFNEHKLEVKLRPSEDTAHILIEGLDIVGVFKNELRLVRQDYIIKKNVILEENYSKLITIPQHGFQISLNHCSSYNEFKSILLDALYEDISNHIINELKKTTLQKWNLDLGKTNLDFKNIVNDNMKILIA